MQADFSLKDQASFQQILPLDQFMAGRRSRKMREQQGERGKKVTKQPDKSCPHPLSSKLLHEEVHTYMFNY